MENPEAPKGRRSIIRGFQIWAAIIGASLTITLLIPHSRGAVILLGLVSIPSYPFLFFLALINSTALNPIIGLPILVIVNSFSYLLVGTLIGWLIQKLKKKS
jgi:hypothetical protein